jgi:transcriptional regulator with XRE-family HTH domain
MAELGNTLSRARRARGITLEDAERDTHVSRRYLQALENEDFSTFPAPVYARGFLRTYSRYLGLNPEELIRVFPNQELTVDITPLPTITRPGGRGVSMNWVIAGAMGVFLLGAALLLFHAGNDTAAVADQPRVSQTITAGGAGQQVIQPPLAATAAGGPVQGKAIAPVQPGVVPNFVGADESSALAVLRDNQMNYIVIAVADKSIAKGLVSSQTPDAGAKSGADTAITLLVSRGPQ